MGKGGFAVTAPRITELPFVSRAVPHRCSSKFRHLLTGGTPGFLRVCWGGGTWRLWVIWVQRVSGGQVPTAKGRPQESAWGLFTITIYKTTSTKGSLKYIRDSAHLFIKACLLHFNLPFNPSRNQNQKLQIKAQTNQRTKIITTKKNPLLSLHFSCFVLTLNWFYSIPALQISDRQL